MQTAGAGTDFHKKQYLKKNGGAYRIRTYDQRVKSPMLYQLS